MVAGYTERWADVEALDERDLGLEQASLEGAFAKIFELQMSMVSALKAGSMAARRDWRKVCTLESRLQGDSGGELLATDDEFEVVLEALSDGSRALPAL